jgi:ribosomal protein S18 acetylase RimI-like enzyme
MVNVLGEWFKEQNIRICELSVLSMNDMAISFWRSLGFMVEQIPDV